MIGAIAMRPPPVIWDDEHGFIAHSPGPESSYEAMYSLIQQFAYETCEHPMQSSYENFIAELDRTEKNGGLTYAIENTEGWVGGASIQNTGSGVGIGHLIFNRAILSQEEKEAMAKAVIQHAFSQGFRKIQWAFYSTNRALRIFLKKIGAEYEGTLKRHTSRNGEYADTDLMASFAEVRNDD